ncbi:MAG TPA: rRNA maturation RNase YbeY [Candidatus Wallbacteria bacterium]|nr:MAG: Endoribonuclease YbeY [bacterium ADurb.Bin243]HOD41259.1 rRNA maturation RNase YbeY [Candidatus Wallbacteria bacterium]HPG59383.1 rRNA maturation RNase YbeY [Candidatus Wallbacteria bacterium]
MRAFINASDKKYKYSNKSILKIADELACYFNVSGDYELGIHFCSYTRIRKLNSEYRNKNTATDVLSFAVNEPGEIKGRNFKSGLPMLLGDIFLCPDYILKNNVIRGGASLCSETAYLMVHGFMHLIGYDHPEGDYENSKMRKDAEKFIDKKLGGINLKSLIKIAKG